MVWQKTQSKTSSLFNFVDTQILITENIKVADVGVGVQKLVLTNKFSKEPPWR